jgi:hypothetical protein
LLLTIFGLEITIFEAFLTIFGLKIIILNDPRYDEPFILQGAHPVKLLAIVFAFAIKVNPVISEDRFGDGCENPNSLWDQR